MSNKQYHQLQMMYPPRLHATPPEVQLPAGYVLRGYQAGDEPAFYALMALAGWAGWYDGILAPWLARIIPDGWFFIVHEASGTLVATAMALHSHSEQHPFGGELGWVAAHPAHAGNGLGMAVSAAVTRRMLSAGYRNIHLYTEDFRLAALRSYFKLGYEPFLYLPDMPERWRTICDQIHWAYTPEAWRKVAARG